MYDAIENQPAFSPVDVEIEACKTITGNPNDTQWHTIPVLIGDIVNNSAPVYAYMNYPDPAVWPHVANLGFVEKIPPDCPSADGNFYDNSSWVQIPDVDLVPYPNSVSVGGTICSENPNRLAFFSPVLDPPLDRTNLYHLTPNDILACYNRILQTWQFNLNQSIKINYIVEICSTNISNKNITIINSLNDITNISSNNCIIALASFEGHKFYPYRIPNGGYAIKEALLLHENEHKDKFEKFKNDYLYLWEAKIEAFKNQCSAFANIPEAKEAALNMYRFSFSNYYTTFSSTHNKIYGLSPKNDLLHDREEQRVNNRKEMKELIEKYILAIKNHCKF